MVNAANLLSTFITSYEDEIPKRFKKQMKAKSFKASKYNFCIAKQKNFTIFIIHPQKGTYPCFAGVAKRNACLDRHDDEALAVKIAGLRALKELLKLGESETNDLKCF